MPNEFIVEGIKNAVKKGESLQQAMISFHNAGYDKKEIEEAARIVQTMQVRSQISSRTLPPQAPQRQPITQNPSAKPVIQKNQVASTNPQKVSSYGEKKSEPKKTLIILLTILIILSLGALISIFLFKESLISFFDNLF